ncbi:MAG: hypothetical protein II064_04515, partial [Bacteroidales bacterium]|nr:hypothetical protein [Bacteroidales bacterium]
MKKVISLILALCMILSLLTVSAIAAEPVRNGTAVSYVDENGDTRTCTDYTTASAAGTTWTGWIVVTEDTIISQRIYASGDVSLILMDGVALNAQYGIEVTEMDNLTVYGQANGTGILNAGDETVVSQITEQNYTGIGGNNHLNAGPITVNGGIINARGAAGAAGIGGGFFAGGGTITINAGMVNAWGGDSGDGIGDGESADDTSEITINGGTVNAWGGASAAGIGVNGFSNEGFVVINGGTVKAYGGPGGGANGDGAGAGIGGDPIGSEVSDITINGGAVWAYGGEAVRDIGGVGIGGGSNGGFLHTVTINGGVVYAEGTGEFPAIGAAGGANFTADEPEIGTININGGQVTAVSADCDYAIGGYCEWFEDAPAYINLSWTNEDDFVLADAYRGTVTLRKDFVNAADNTETFETGAVEDNAVLAGKKLVPPAQEPGTSLDLT